MPNFWKRFCSKQKQTTDVKNFNDNDRIVVPRFNECEGFYTTKKHSATMSKIRSKNTKPEIILRKALWNLGFRYRLNSNRIAGRPDIVFKAKRLLIFVDGDFWHGYNWDERKTKIKTNRNYWIPKIERNIQRDKETNDQLKKEGWKLIRIWEHEIKKQLDLCVKKIAALHNECS